MTKLRMLMAVGAIVVLAGCTPLSANTVPPAGDEGSTASRAYTDQEVRQRGWDLRDAQI